MKEKWLTEKPERNPPAKLRALGVRCRLDTAMGGLGRQSDTLGEIVATPSGGMEPPARAIGEITGEIVARLKLLFELDVATAARN